MEENAIVEMSLVCMDGLLIVSATCHVGNVPGTCAEDYSEIVYTGIERGLAWDNSITFRSSVSSHLFLYFKKSFYFWVIRSIIILFIV